MSPAPKNSLRLASRLLPVLLLLLVVAQLINPYRGWVILLVGLGGAWLVGYIWARALAMNLRIAREVRFGWAQVGDRLEERFTLVNRSVFPALWVEVLDGSTLPDYSASQVRVVDGNAVTRWHTEGVCTRRGLFQLGPTRLRAGDPFGLCTVEVENLASTQILVTPPIIPLPNVEVASGGRAGEGRYRTNAPEKTVSAGSVREYLPEDSLRWIHWPTTARRDDLYVRVFDGTPSGDWWIFLDLDRRTQLGYGEVRSEEDGVVLAASLSDRGLRSGRAVGLATNSQEPVWMPPQLGEGRQWEILRALALAQPGEHSLADLLARAGPVMRQRTSVVIITPAVGKAWVDRLIPLLERGAVPTIMVLDSRSYGGTEDRDSGLQLLAELSVRYYVVGHELFEHPDARPGTKGRWDWVFSPSGKAIPVHQPQDLTWRPLS